MGTDLLIIVPFALLVGVTLGALGGGGAILTVPILVYLLGVEPLAATAGSLVIVALTSLAGVVTHGRAGNVRLRSGLLFGVVGVVGSLAGSWLAAGIDPAVLLTAFGALMIVVGVLMLRRAAEGKRSGDGKNEGGEGGEGEAGVDGNRRRGWLPLVLAATGVGFLTGLFGVGGGFAVVPALVLALGYAMPAAVGTSLVVIIVNSAVALAARVVGGVEIDWPLILTFSALGAVGSVLGGRIASRVDPHHLSRAFAVLLFLVAGYVLVQNVPALVGA